MDKISIIIPIYNVELYIKKCLDSVINQTYRNIEIICVDDGSTDNSGNICDEYAERDSRIKVIHKKNEGNPSAINLGLDIFTGEYVGIVDPDDWIELDYYEVAHNLIQNNSVDFVCVGFCKETLEGNIFHENKLPIKNIEVYTEEILRYTFIRDKYPIFGAYLWNKLFKAKFFKKMEEGGYEIRLDSKMEVGGDVLLFTECVLKSNCAIYCEKKFYHYLIREGSLSRSKELEKRMGSLRAHGKIIEILEINNICEDIVKWVKRFFVYHASLLTELTIENNDIINLKLMQNEMKRYLKEYIETNKEYPDRINRINKLLSYDSAFLLQ